MENNLWERGKTNSEAKGYFGNNPGSTEAKELWCSPRTPEPLEINPLYISPGLWYDKKAQRGGK